MKLPSRPLLLALAFASIAVAVAEVNPGALISPSCAPWDAPALSLSIPTRPGKLFPLARIQIYRNPPIKGPATYVFKSTDSSDAGNATYCKTKDDCAVLPEARIEFTHFESEKIARGNFRLKLEGGKTVSGKFDAGWGRQKAPCG
jgi:hypothetical protein